MARSCSTARGQIASAYPVQGGRWLGSELVKRKSNEIPAPKPCCGGRRSKGCRSPPPPCTPKPRPPGSSCRNGADYLLTVKGNQPTVAKNFPQLQAGLARAVSPSAPTDIVQWVGLNRSRLEARCLIRFDDTAEQACSLAVQQAARLTRSSNRRQATLQGFYNFMVVRKARKVSLVPVSKGTWLPPQEISATRTCRIRLLVVSDPRLL